MEELREGMMEPDNLTETILHAINSPDNCVTEEITIRRVLGDF